MTELIRTLFRRGGRITRRLLEKLSLRLALPGSARSTDTPRQPALDYLTDALVERDGLVIRVLCSERVRLDDRYLDLASSAERQDTRTGGAAAEALKAERVDETYREWIAPLLNLPRDATFEELTAEVEKLLADRPWASLHFPLKNYLRSLSRNTDDLRAWAHRCSVSGEPSLQVLQALTGQQAKAENVSKPPEILIHAATEAYLTKEFGVGGDGRRSA